MNYETANSQLDGRCKLSRKVGNNTYLIRNSRVPWDSIHLKLHNTYIITWYADGRTELNSGGWRTVTTKARMNEYLEGYGISQVRGQWYVGHINPNTHGEWIEDCLYDDGIVFNPDGTITGGEPIAKVRELLALRRKVNRFATSYIKAFKDGKVPAPSAGDCFYCGMRTVDGNKPLGECTHDTSHILSHIEENYFVPSLLYRAFETMPHSQAMGWAFGKHWDGQCGNIPDFVYDQLKKSLSRYMLRQLGQAA
jgi:hypothetical protein